MKIVLGVQYCGKNYNGWQKQTKGKTIQSTIEMALSDFTQEKILTYAAGRTDTGVHATGQVIHFETNINRPSYSWVYGLNSILPDDISITDMKEVKSDFHARFSALKRTYRYIIYNHSVRPVMYNEKVSWYKEDNLDEQTMAKAAKHIIGEKDFSCFRSANCQSRSSVKKIYDLQVKRTKEFIHIDITANAFLYNMVRNIVGSLVLVGAGKKKTNWIKDLIEIKDRCEAGKKFPAHGLYLVHVEYDKIYEIDFKRSFPHYY